MNVFEYLLSKVKEKKAYFGFGMTEREEIQKSKMKGEFFLRVQEGEEILEERHFCNIIVDDASLLIARLLADGQASLDPVGPAHGIWVLGVGTGDPGWDTGNPPAATETQSKLEAELARKRFTNVYFVKTDGSGLPASEVTNIIDFQTVFNESEAVGGIMELGLFGGDADELVQDSGTMINYRTIAVINKPNSATLSVIFRLTT